MTQASSQTASGIAARAHRFGYALSVSGSILSRFAMLTVLILLPRAIGLTEYGFFALVITMGEIIEMTSSNWTRLLLVRESVREDAFDDRPGWRLASIIGLAAIGSIAIALFLSPLAVRHDRIDFSWAVAIYVFAFFLFRLSIATLQAQNRQQLIGLLEFTRGIMMLVMVGAAVLWRWHSFFFPALGVSAAALVAALVCYPTIRNGLNRQLEIIITREIFLTIGIPIILATLLTFQFGWLDRLVIQSAMGPQYVGLYVAATAIARQPIDLLMNALNTQTFPVMMVHSRSPNSHQISGIMLSSCILAFGAAGGAISLAGPLVQVAMPAFDQKLAVALIAPIAGGAVLLGLKHFIFDNIFHSHGENWLMLRWFTLVSMATFGLSVVAVQHYGPLGAAYAFMAGSGASLAISALVSQRFCEFRWPLAAIARVALSALLACGAAVAGLRLVGDASPWLQLIVGSLAFCSAYLAGLIAFVKFNLRRFMSTPWEFDFLRGAASQ